MNQGALFDAHPRRSIGRDERRDKETKIGLVPDRENGPSLFKSLDEIAEQIAGIGADGERLERLKLLRKAELVGDDLGGLMRANERAREDEARFDLEPLERPPGEKAAFPSFLGERP